MTFVRTVTITAEESERSPDRLTRLRRRDIDGVIVKGVYDRATCEAVCRDLEQNCHALIRTDFPAKFAAFFYDINLNFAHPDLKEYFAEVPRFRTGLSKLLAGERDLQKRLTGLMSALDGGLPYGPVPGPPPSGRICRADTSRRISTTSRRRARAIGCCFR
jgi:hypothetical protein